MSDSHNDPLRSIATVLYTVRFSPLLFLLDSLVSLYFDFLLYSFVFPSFGTVAGQTWCAQTFACHCL